MGGILNLTKVAQLADLVLQRHFRLPDPPYLYLKRKTSMLTWQTLRVTISMLDIATFQLVMETLDTE